MTDSDWHHIWPLGLGGPDKAWNRVPVCQTGHRSIHVLLSMYRLHGGKPPWPTLREFGPGERKIAAEGWKRYKEQSGT